MKPLIIVESPAKARTISRYLGSDYVVESSIGHVQDLPATAAEIPAKHKGKPWSRLGVDVENGFAPLYIIPPGKKAQIAKLKKLLKDASELYLATDEDREGESIAWHLYEVLKPRVPVKRMVFHEITQKAIKEALEHPREIDMKRVEAQEARRILDRLFGYEISPILWRKLKPKLSAGRVQSVAVRMVVERERERIAFVPAVYWGIEADLNQQDAQDSDETELRAKLSALGNKKVASGKDCFDVLTGRLLDVEKTVCLDEEMAKSLAHELASARFVVREIVEKPFTQRPSPAFITSTLQQEAGRRFGYTAQRTMRLAQGLYENGYITYMRTDSTTLSGQALTGARKQIVELYGSQYLPDSPRFYQRKAKGAQEAHEAIRPAGDVFRTPEQVKNKLDTDAFRLYELIWRRTVACQMKNAEGMRTHIRIETVSETHGTAVFTASGSVISFDGYLRLYGGGEDRFLPKLEKGQTLEPGNIEPASHMTQPAARYTEATLIKDLETKGIGRPSTYANIIQTILNRSYVWKKGSALVPTMTAIAVVQLLESYFAYLVDYDFTAKMELDLDKISDGNRESRPWLASFYFGDADAVQEDGGAVAPVGLRSLISAGEETIDARRVASFFIGKDDEDRDVYVRLGRYGAYYDVGDGQMRATLPDRIPPDEMNLEMVLEYCRQKQNKQAQILGEDPETGKPIYVKDGRFGPYVQMGDPEVNEKGKVKRGGKPKMASLWPGMKPEEMTLEEAFVLLSFPKVLGEDPVTSEPITAQNGRYGPYLKMADETRSLENHEALRTVTLEEALVLFSQPKKQRKRASSAVRTVGKDENGVDLKIKSGRYGPYVTNGEINASIPKDMDPNQLTLEEAKALVEKRRANPPKKRKKTTRKKRAKKSNASRKS